MQHNQLFTATLADLRARLGERAAIRLGEAGAILGFTPATTHKKHCQGTFPVPVLRGDGSAPTVSIYALAAHLAGTDDLIAAPAADGSCATRIGRPSRAEVREASLRGVTVRELRKIATGGRP